VNRSLRLLRLLALAGLAAAAPARAGATVVTGRPSDASGQPVAGLEVAIEASRSRFDIRAFRRVVEGTERFPAVAGEHGEFTVEWPESGEANHFELVAGFRVRKPGGERFVELGRSDITRRMGAGSPVVATLEIADTSLLEAMRSFLASLRSADERRTYEELGKPDSIEILRGPGWVESTWWYFEEGRACRFRDGVRLEVRTFDPVRAF
jgi:hypothetical protein